MLDSMHSRKTWEGGASRTPTGWSTRHLTRESASPPRTEKAACARRSALHAYLFAWLPRWSQAGFDSPPGRVRTTTEGIIAMEHVTTTSGQRPNGNSTASRKYMWLITVQWPVGNGGFGNATLCNTVDIPAGTSRLDVYSQIFELAKRETRADTLNVLFFSLEPDQLAS
ncbi:hypothetical protein E1295_44345 [Nonomuraea mesophila]|uniref:Uncharacterized protein n=1 Tax=Nonomuraea mesophila TaxID=2530382 RepID=A0A4R5E6L0_9ACTN|nr:hypothetical protein [Nonomuraea mesophila]TDE26427.1 hypothetical protein E1295_44345 [Nonomuraea mesophila]